MRSSCHARSAYATTLMFARSAVGKLLFELASKCVKKDMLKNALVVSKLIAETKIDKIRISAAITLACKGADGGTACRRRVLTWRGGVASAPSNEARRWCDKCS